MRRSLGASVPLGDPGRSIPLVNKGRGRTGIGASDVLALRRGREREFAYERRSPMWVLMYVFSYSVSPAATADKAEWRLLPTVVFQEFSNEERCRAAKSTLEGSLKEAGAKLKSGLDDLKSIGKADPAQLIIAFNVECLPK